MTRFVLFFLSLLAATPALAQIPVIDSMDIDESSSTLTIHGLHGSEKGRVSVDGVDLTIQSWANDLITCAIPPSGKGSAGPVVVSNTYGETKPRQITKWHFDVYRWHAPPDNPFSQVERERYYLDWRFDLHSRMLAKNGDINAWLIPMKSSWHTDTIIDGKTFRATDTIVERPYSGSQIVLWYLHEFQNGHGELMAFLNQSSLYQFDSGWKSKPYHDTVKNSQGVWVQENSSSGSVEFTPPQQAVWLMSKPTLKYESITPQVNRVQLQWWFVPWAEQYELRVTRIKPDSVVVLDSIFTATTYPLITVTRSYPDGQYIYSVRASNSEGPYIWGSRSFTLGHLGVSQGDQSPATLVENPVHQTLSFQIGDAPNCSLRLFDALGREQPIGQIRQQYGIFELDASTLPSGAYAYDLLVGVVHQTGRVIVVH